MPITPTYPGVYIEEIPSGVRTITGVTTSITALVGRTRRGPDNEPFTINSFADDQNPWVSADERLIVFDSNRRGGAADLWAATGDGVDFGVPFALEELNSPVSDEGATLTRDGRTVFFASNRDGGEGGLDVWMATRGSVGEAFSSPENLGSTINSPDDELDLALGPDGQELFFTSSRGGRGYQLFRARRGCEPLVGEGAD